MCFVKFPSDAIERHAARCDGTKPDKATPPPPPPPPPPKKKDDEKPKWWQKGPLKPKHEDPRKSASSTPPPAKAAPSTPPPAAAPVVPRPKTVADIAAAALRPLDNPTLQDSPQTVVFLALSECLAVCHDRAWRHSEADANADANDADGDNTGPARDMDDASQIGSCLPAVAAMQLHLLRSALPGASWLWKYLPRDADVAAQDAVARKLDRFLPPGVGSTALNKKGDELPEDDPCLVKKPESTHHYVDRCLAICELSDGKVAITHSMGKLAIFHPMSGILEAVFEIGEAGDHYGLTELSLTQKRSCARGLDLCASRYRGNLYFLSRAGDQKKVLPHDGGQMGLCELDQGRLALTTGSSLEILDISPAYDDSGFGARLQTVKNPRSSPAKSVVHVCPGVVAVPNFHQKGMGVLDFRAGAAVPPKNRGVAVEGSETSYGCGYSALHDTVFPSKKAPLPLCRERTVPGAVTPAPCDPDRAAVSDDDQLFDVVTPTESLMLAPTPELKATQRNYWQVLNVHGTTALMGGKVLAHCNYDKHTVCFCVIGEYLQPNGDAAA